MRRTNNTASKALLTLATSALLLCPVPALATSAKPQSGTGTTEVTIQAGSGWDQIVQSLPVVNQAHQSTGGLANTGESVVWPTVLLAGTAVCCVGLLVRNREKSGGRDDDANTQ